MAANNRGNMRPTSRSPPFLAIGLVVALCILGFNYWSLSARNGDLANDLAVMESELRLATAKKVSAEKRSEATLDKVKELEDYLSKEKAKYSDKERDFEDKAKAERDLQDENNNIKSEKDDCLANVKTCEEQNKALIADRETLKAEVETLKNTPAETKVEECTESSCAQFVTAAQHKLFYTLESTSNLQALQALGNSGIDLGPFAEKVKDLAPIVAAQGLNQDQAQPVDVPVEKEKAEQEVVKTIGKNSKAFTERAHKTVKAVTTGNEQPAVSTTTEKTSTARGAPQQTGDKNQNVDNIKQMDVATDDIRPIVAGDNMPLALDNRPVEDPDEDRHEEDEDKEAYRDEDDDEDFADDDLGDLDNDKDDYYEGAKGINVADDELKTDDKNIEEMRQNLEKQQLN